MIPPEYIPETTPRASENPMIINGDLGRASISSVAMTEQYLIWSTEKYMAKYLGIIKKHHS